MRNTVRLTAGDGHELDAYEAGSNSAPNGSIIVVQEIFGLTPHIRRVVQQFADEGFHVVAPAMFDRVESGIVLEYSDIDTGRAYMQQLEWSDTLLDIGAALGYLDTERPCIIVGYCWGGTVAHVAASELDVDIAVAYYGGGISHFLDRLPTCPIMYHFGAEDHAISIDAVRKIEAAHPKGVFHVYDDAGHGFNCDDRDSFDFASARLAFERTLSFIAENSQ